MVSSIRFAREIRSRTCAAVGVLPAGPAGRNSGGGVGREGSTVAAIGGGPAGGPDTVAAGGGDDCPAGRAGAVTGGRSGSGVAGVSVMTAGTGSIATRGGGSGISSGTFADVRAALDAHAPASSVAAKTPVRVITLIPNANLRLRQGYGGPNPCCISVRLMLTQRQ